MRILIQYDDAPADGSSPGASGAKRSVSIKPESAVIKIASPLSGDHGVAMRLRLYEREWQFYEELSSRVRPYCVVETGVPCNPYPYKLRVCQILKL